MRVTVDEKHQIAIPATARHRLRIEAGTELLVEVREGYLALIPEPRDYARRLRGLHREVWAETDPDEYVRREREAWQDQEQE